MNTAGSKKRLGTLIQDLYLYNTLLGQQTQAWLKIMFNDSSSNLKKPDLTFVLSPTFSWLSLHKQKHWGHRGQQHCP